MAAVTIYLNGEIKEVPAEIPLDQLLDFFSLPSSRIAIELNKKVVRRQEWKNVIIVDSDRIEIVHFVGGG